MQQTGVQKLLIEGFERAENECDALKAYVDKYHGADKMVAQLTEKLKVSVANEILSGVGLTGGGAMISLASSFLKTDTIIAVAGIGIGFLFIIGSTAARVVQVRR